MSKWLEVDRRSVVCLLIGASITYSSISLFIYSHIKQDAVTVKKSNWKIFCWITTMPSYHQSRAIAVRNTWAKRCDQFVFMSSKNDTNLPALAIVEKDYYDGLWNKTMRSLEYLEAHYGNKFDFFFKADDDTYVVMDNLRDKLEKYNPDEPILLGTKLPAFLKGGYPAGGIGYVISRSALHKITTGFKTVTPCAHSPYKTVEDISIAVCANAVNVTFIGIKGANGQNHGYDKSPFQMIPKYGFRTPLNILVKHPLIMVQMSSRMVVSHQSFSQADPTYVRCVEVTPKASDLSTQLIAIRVFPLLSSYALLC